MFSRFITPFILMLTSFITYTISLLRRHSSFGVAVGELDVGVTFWEMFTNVCPLP